MTATLDGVRAGIPRARRPRSTNRGKYTGGRRARMKEKTRTCKKGASTAVALRHARTDATDAMGGQTQARTKDDESGRECDGGEREREERTSRERREGRRDGEQGRTGGRTREGPRGGAARSGHRSEARHAARPHRKRLRDRRAETRPRRARSTNSADARQRLPQDTAQTGHVGQPRDDKTRNATGTRSTMDA